MQKRDISSFHPVRHKIVNHGLRSLVALDLRSQIPALKKHVSERYHQLELVLRFDRTVAASAYSLSFHAHQWLLTSFSLNDPLTKQHKLISQEI